MHIHVKRSANNYYSDKIQIAIKDCWRQLNEETKNSCRFHVDQTDIFRNPKMCNGVDYTTAWRLLNTYYFVFALVILGSGN